MTTPDLTRDLEPAKHGKSIAEWVREALDAARSEPPNSVLAQDIRDIVETVEAWRKSQAVSALSEPAAPAGAIEDIVRERQRQISFEGWTPEHDDDQHDKGEMARAAACYAYEATRTEHQRSLDDGFAPPMWPWAERWWKPTDRRRDLIKAGALIVAEIERLDRALATPQPVDPPDDSLNDIAAGNEAARDDEWGEAGE